jgi:hypothetical protein
MHEREFEANSWHSFTHEGHPIDIATQQVHHNRDFAKAEVCLSQTVLNDDGDFKPERVGVVIKFADLGFTANSARELARALETLADQIDAQ